MGEVTQVEVTADNYVPEEGESASETARNIANLLKTRDDNGDQSEGSKEGQKIPEEKTENTGDKTEQIKADKPRDETGKFAKQKVDKANDPELQPPTILDPSAKKLFLNLPEGLKRETHRLIKSIQANGTRTQQQLTESLKRSEGIINTATSYIRDNNILDEQGRAYQPDRLFNELLTAHNNIIKDPDRYIAQIIQSSGASTENISAYLQGKNPTGVDVSKDPIIRALQNELSTVKAKLSEREVAEMQQKSAPIAEQFTAVMQEIDPASGNYRYPELLDEAFLESTKPIVAALMRTDTNLSPGEALKKAHGILTGKQYSQNAPKQIAPTQQINYNDRARQAAVSVRGKVPPIGSAGSNSSDLELHEIPQSATETARLIAQRLAGG